MAYNALHVKLFKEVLKYKLSNTNIKFDVWLDSSNVLRISYALEPFEVSQAIPYDEIIAIPEDKVDNSFNNFIDSKLTEMMKAFKRVFS